VLPPATGRVALQPELPTNLAPVNQPYFLTTAIDYTNGAPHIGHAYEKVLADAIARYHRLKGESVFFLTGVDQHGQKVQQSAEKQGVGPQIFVDGVTAQFRLLWDALEVRYDGWAATTETRHKDFVRALLQRLWDDHDPATGASRWIYKEKRGGYYSIRQEQFLTDKERGPDGEFGPEWGQVEFREEDNYYFRLEGSRQWLLDLIDRRSREGQPLVLPEFRVAELRNAVEKLGGDLCISRPKARLSWGIEFPFDADYVTYVWFDALVNYLSFAPASSADGVSPQTGFRIVWPPLHLIGKDILIPAHGVYWPIMLHALGFADDEMPTFLVHGWWNIGGEKMSKSVGNSVDPVALVEKYGADAVRFYLLSDIATGRDADFSEDRLIGSYNSVLANNLGNLLNRSLNMAQRYRAGVLKKAGCPAWAALENYTRCCEQFEFNQGLQAALTLAVSANELIEKTKPWALAKDPDRAGELDEVLYTLAETLRRLAILISPVLPRAAHGIFDQLNWKTELASQERRFSLAEVAEEHSLPDGHRLNAPVPLFPRIEVRP
jgi:methionyl-tRNA synthetase